MPDNRKPLIYGAFPVCRNYTVRAHIRNLSTAKRRRRENGIQYAWTLRRGIHAKNLHPRHTPDAGKRSRKDGQFHGTSDVNKQKKHRASERIPSISSPPLFGHFAVWVRKIRHLKNRTNKRENRRKSYDFHRFLELVAGLEPATC